MKEMCKYRIRYREPSGTVPERPGASWSVPEYIPAERLVCCFLLTQIRTYVLFVLLGKATLLKTC